jgi:hypothetical protein
MKTSISKISTIFVISFFVSLNCFAQWEQHVTVINSEPNKTVKVTSKLQSGINMPDLSWASKSSVACFPATQNNKFNGKHVLFATKIPPKSEMYITLIPTDKNSNISLYAYQIGESNYTLVPGLASCVTCEAEHKWDYPKKGKTQDHTRTVRLNAINNGYNVVIGVAGANNLSEGVFILEIKLISSSTTNTTQETVKVTSINSVVGKDVEVKGNLSSGVKIHDLSWASKSSVACFPATQNSKFTGNHVLYTTDLPQYSDMEITVISTNTNQNFSIYAYSIGANKNEIVPNLASCVSCEAEHKWDYPKKGKTQDHTRTVKLNALNNPYKVVIGVVGANELNSGEYTLKISTTSKK